MSFRRGGYRGGNRNYQPNNNNNRYQSLDHDDRGDHPKPSNIKRRVSFKNTHINRNAPVNNMRVKAFLEDENMADEFGIGESSHRLSGEFRRGGGSNFRNRRKGSPIPRQMGGRLIQTQSGWYRVTIPYGFKYPKEEIFKQLLDNISPSVFIPNYFKSEPEKNECSFFVEDFDVAEKILRLDRKIQMADGHKMIIKVVGSLPQVSIDETLKEKMKLAMAKRYNAATKALDLSKFHADSDLADVFCPLFRPQIMAAVVNILGENIPDLEALSLNENKLNLLDNMKLLPQKLPNIKILYLANNKISLMSSFDVFKSLKLVELNADGNPFKKRYKDNAVYIRYHDLASAGSTGVT